MLSYSKTLKIFLIMLCSLLAKQMVYSQDFEISLNSLGEGLSTVCIGDTLKLQINVVYNGATLDLSSGTLNYYVGEVSEATEPFYTNDIFEDTPIVLYNNSVIVDDTICLEITDDFQFGENTISVRFVSNIEDVNPDNDDAPTVDIIVNCQYADFQGVLDTLASEQDTLYCDTDKLYLNAGVKYNGTETITVDTLYLNYGINNDSQLVYQEVLYNETFEPGEVIYRSRNINTLNPVFTAGSQNLILIWPTVSRIYLDTTPENDFAIDSTYLGCQGVEFEGVLVEPLAPEQDTLYCNTNSLYLNAGVKYNGTETITVDTLYLNYGINNDSQLVHQDTLYNETFDPGETMYRSRNINTLNPIFTAGSQNLILIWPTVSRMYLDTTPENDFAIDSTYLGCQGVDFEGVLVEPLAPEQDTLYCDTSSLYLNAGVRYNGTETITVDTLYLNYGINNDSQIVHQDTLYNETFGPGETMYRSRNISTLNPVFTAGSQNLILIWPTVSRIYLDTTPKNDFVIDSTYFDCYQSDLGLSWGDSYFDKDTICNELDTLHLSFSLYNEGGEPIELDTLILNYYIGADVADGVLPTPTYQDTIIYEGLIEWGDTIPFNEDIAIEYPLFTPNSDNTIMVWFDSPEFVDNNSDNNILSDIITVCVPILPLDLVSFTGEYLDNKVNLTWEVNSLVEGGDYVQIERSKNGLDFNIIGRVDVDGQLNIYEYEDNNPYLIGYYRLRIIDIEGMVKYSPVLILKKESRNTLDIESTYLDKYNKFNIIYSSPGNDIPYVLSIYDIAGRLIYQETIADVQFGFNQKQIDLKGLTTGIYILSIQNNHTIKSTKFIR